jgi:hypothetical protein
MTNQPTNSKPKKDSRHISDADRNYLWMTSAGRCAYPDCRILLVEAPTATDGPATIGKFAHIAAHSKKGPRADSNGFTAETNSHENLILLCGNHHDKVDVQYNTFTASELKRWKEEHEAWVLERLATEKFDNADLQSIITWITDRSAGPTEDLTIKAPDEKIVYNNMSETTRRHITTGLIHVGEVRTYISHRAKLEDDYPERVLGPLLSIYNEMRTKDLNSDIIFEELCSFACGRSLDFRKRLSGLAVIAYFFERCEVFEK